jgi:hypothetical protein
MLGAIEGGHPFRQDPHPIVSNPCLCDSECSGSDSQMRKFESRMPIPYALETDWPVGVAGFETLHFRIGVRQDSQLGAGFEPLHLRI